MKVNFNRSIKDLAGEDLTENKVLVTLKVVATNALMATFEDEKGLSGAEKLTRYVLGQKIHAAGADEEVEVTAEEVTLLKLLIGKAFGPLIVGSAYQLLENT